MTTDKTKIDAQKSRANGFYYFRIRAFYLRHALKRRKGKKSHLIPKLDKIVSQIDTMKEKERQRMAKRNGKSPRLVIAIPKNAPSQEMCDLPKQAESPFAKQLERIEAECAKKQMEMSQQKERKTHQLCINKNGRPSIKEIIPLSTKES